MVRPLPLTETAANKEEEEWKVRLILPSSSGASNSRLIWLYRAS